MRPSICFLYLPSGGLTLKILAELYPVFSSMSNTRGTGSILTLDLMSLGFPAVNDQKALYVRINCSFATFWLKRA